LNRVQTPEVTALLQTIWNNRPGEFHLPYFRTPDVPNGGDESIGVLTRNCWRERKSKSHGMTRDDMFLRGKRRKNRENALNVELWASLDSKKSVTQFRVGISLLNIRQFWSDSSYKGVCFNGWWSRMLIMPWYESDVMHLIWLSKQWIGWVKWEKFADSSKIMTYSSFGHSIARIDWRQRLHVPMTLKDNDLVFLVSQKWIRIEGKFEMNDFDDDHLLWYWNIHFPDLELRKLNPIFYFSSVQPLAPRPSLITFGSICSHREEHFDPFLDILNGRLINLSISFRAFWSVSPSL
jgi:hypothetical protein